MGDDEINSLKDLDLRTLVVLTYREVREMKEGLKTDYVSKDQFLPVRRCCYALTGSIFAAALAALVTYITK